jgi:ATP-dependent helicase YprA (DUF1998 family)
LDEIEQSNGEEEEEEAEEEEEDEESVEEQEEEENAEEKPIKQRKLLELERLAWVVREIDSETALAARGFIVQSATGVYSASAAFPGLRATELESLEHYLIVRPPRLPATLAAIRSAGVSANPHCLDSLSRVSEAEGVQPIWSVSVDESGAKAKVRSLKWLGYEFSISALEGNGSGAYFGAGQKNQDLLFMN